MIVPGTNLPRTANRQITLLAQVSENNGFEKKEQSQKQHIFRCMRTQSNNTSTAAGVAHTYLHPSSI